MFTIRGENVYPSRGRRGPEPARRLRRRASHRDLARGYDGRAADPRRSDRRRCTTANGGSRLPTTRRRRCRGCWDCARRSRSCAPGTFPRTDFKARRVIDDREVFRDLNARLGGLARCPTSRRVELVARRARSATRARSRGCCRAPEPATTKRATALDTIFAKAGRAHVVGITGVPGSGKSTLVAKLATAIRASGRTIGDRRDRPVVAVLRRRDPRRPHPHGGAWRRSRRVRAQHGHARRARRAWPAARSTRSTCSTPQGSTS